MAVGSAPAVVASSPPAFPAFASGVIFGCLSEFIRQGYFVDGMAEQVFDGLEFILFLFADEGASGAVGLSAGRTADTVDIVFAVVGDVVVDDHFDVVDINPAGEDVGGDQDG